MDFSTALSPQITRALSNTFIYSLWQGLILAATAGLIILLTQKAASRRRYNLLITSLILFSAGVIFTFIYQLQQPSVTATPSPAVQQMLTSSPDEAVKFTPATVAPASNTSFIDYINTHAGTIVLIWFLIVCARCLQLLTGLHGLYRLRHESVSAIGRDWEERLQALATGMGIKQMVAVAESGLAKVPMVIGHLKPIILIPAGLITAMPPAEIEAILIHELAHIRRRDYLVNLLQHLVEIVFFFNPAVLWVSSLIKAERENCCDDITLTQTNSKAAYIRALISCQEYQLRTPRFAMALGKRKNLLGRVSRMVSSSNHSLSILEKSLLTVCLVTAGLGLAAFSGKEKKQETEITLKKNTAITQSTQQEHSAEICAPDTVPAKPRIYQLNEVGDGTSLATTDVRGNIKYTTYIFKKEGVLYQCNFEEGKMNSLQVNGKTIPADKWAGYKSTVDKLISAHDSKSKESMAELTVPDESRMDPVGAADESQLNGLKKSVQELDKAKLALNDSIRQLKAKLIEENAIYTKDDLEQYRKTGTDYKAYNAYIANNAYKANEAYKAKAVKYQAKIANTDVKLYNNHVEVFQPYNEYKAVSDLSYLKPGAPVIKTGVQEYKPRDGKSDWVTTEVLVAAMVKEGIVSRPQDIKSFMISNEQMILNGKTMSADIHRLMVDKYVRPDTDKDWSIYYNFDTSTMKKTVRTVRNAD